MVGRGIGRWHRCGCCDDCGGCCDDWVGWVIGVGGGCCDDWLGWVIVGGGGWVGGAGSVGGVGWLPAVVTVGGAVSVDGIGWVDGVGWVGGAGSGCWGQLFQLWPTSLHMLHFLVMPCFVICFPFLFISQASSLLFFLGSPHLMPVTRVYDGIVGLFIGWDSEPMRDKIFFT